MARKHPPKKIPPLRPDRWLRFDERDRELIMDAVRPDFVGWIKRKMPVGTISARYESRDKARGELRAAFWVELNPPPDLPKVRRCLESLGIPRRDRDEIVDFYRGHNRANLPAIAEWLQDTDGMGWWFAYLERFSLERLPVVLSADSKNLEKWDDKFRRYRVGWPEVHLTSNTIADIIVELLDEMGIGDEAADRETIKKKHQRWSESITQ